MRTRYRFSHRSDDGLTYWWVATRRPDGESRTEHIWCPVAWFWNPTGGPR